MNIHYTLSYHIDDQVLPRVALPCEEPPVDGFGARRGGEDLMLVLPEVRAAVALGVAGGADGGPHRVVAVIAVTSSSLNTVRSCR